MHRQLTFLISRRILAGHLAPKCSYQLGGCCFTCVARVSYIIRGKLREQSSFSADLAQVIPLVNTRYSPLMNLSSAALKRRANKVASRFCHRRTNDRRIGLDRASQAYLEFSTTR